MVSLTNIVTEMKEQINPHILPKGEGGGRFGEGRKGMQKYTHVLWDFNGTLLDDVDASIESANALLERHGLPPIESVEAYRLLFGFPIIDYYRRLGFDFERDSYADLAVEWVAYYLKYSALSTLYPDVVAGLERVGAMGISQLVLSATERGMLERQILDLGIYCYFEGLLGMENIHAYSKEEIALGWRERHPDARILLVGDTDHDADVARAIGADCILLSSGHQSAERLAACRPLAVAGSITEALNAVLGIE